MHPLEAVARAIAEISIGIVEPDGREELYDEVSWDYVDPYPECFRELKAFASGVARSELK